MTDRKGLQALFPASLADIPAEHRPKAPLEQRQYLVNGHLRDWQGPCQEVYSPVCLSGSGKPKPVLLGQYPLLGEDEAMAALHAARTAWNHGRGDWPTMPVEQRIRHVEEFALRMVAVRQAVVQLLMWEVGKALPEALKEFDRTVDYLRDTVQALKELDRTSSRFVQEGDVFGQIRRAPFGVVLCMGPFNYPLNETFTTLIPALIMGNPVIFKPPKLGVLLHAPLLEAFRDSFPPGVVNTVYGDGQKVIGPLMKSGGIDVLAFIGSSKVANILQREHPLPHRLRCILGLEAKNPAIILPDADLEQTVAECLLGSLSFNGQRCTALKILFVHRRLVDDFLQRFSAAVTGLKAGMPWQEGVKLTPLPEPDKPAWLSGLVGEAVQRGARVANPGGGEHWGAFYQPAVVAGVTPAMQLYRLEQFGPVVPVVAFDDLAEPLDYVVSSSQGQQVSLFGSDPDQLAALIDPLVNQVCRVNLNSQCQRGPDSFPFTGRKDSAEGTLSVSDALRCFSIRTLVAARSNEPNRRIINTIVRERKSRFLSTDFIL